MASDLQKDWNFYFEAHQNRELLLQQCSDCQVVRFPPTPICNKCLSENWQTISSSGKGSVYSYTIMRKSVSPDVLSPIVALVKLEEDVVMPTCLVEVAPEEVQFDMPVELDFRATPDGKRLMPVFTPATGKTPSTGT